MMVDHMSNMKKGEMILEHQNTMAAMKTSRMVRFRARFQ